MKKLVREIVEAIGGKENILNVYHCATRLRFQLKQEDTIQDETVKNIEGVLSVVKGGGQYQIVIGRHVGDVYQELLSVYDMQKEESGLKDAKEFKEEMKDKKTLKPVYRYDFRSLYSDFKSVDRNWNY